MVAPQQHVTEMLIAWAGGDSKALEALLPVVYDELRRMAARHLRNERSDHTLQPTALVHEAYLRLTDQTRMQWQNRTQFFAVAAQMMRRILVDHARTHLAKKRGAGGIKLCLDETPGLRVERAGDLIALDEALSRLGQLDLRQSQVVELRFFGGLSIDETAEALSLSPATVKREWTLAKAWLRREMGG